MMIVATAFLVTLLPSAYVTRAWTWTFHRTWTRHPTQELFEKPVREYRSSIMWNRVAPHPQKCLCRI